MQNVDFYFDFSSTNSYFAAFMLPEICERAGARVTWIPLHLGALFRGTGFDVMAMTPRKARYLWRDHARYAEFTGLPFKRPSRFPIKTADALRCVLVAAWLGRGPAVSTGVAALGAKASDQGERTGLSSPVVAAFSQAVFRAYWERDEDISNRSVLGTIAETVGLDRAATIQAIDTPEIRNELIAITDRAVERGVFGAPTFLVGEEMFWGKDRLHFVERRLKHSTPG
jgi:2-hydroxychromene-2-carboxylate isomerase